VFFRPRNVAVIGAAEETMIEVCRALGFRREHAEGRVIHGVLAI
jgi:hypothetical protein